MAQLIARGLGEAADAGTPEIHWQSNAKENVKVPAVDRLFTITAGHGITLTTCGRRPSPVAAPGWNLAVPRSKQ